MSGSLQAKIYGASQQSGMIAKRMGQYNSPVKRMGFYNGGVKKLGHYNGVGSGKSNSHAQIAPYY